MSPKGATSGSRDEEAYQLLSRETSLEHANGSSTLRDSEDDTMPVHRRVRFSTSSAQQPRGEEFAGLLGRSTAGLRSRIHLSGGLKVSLELITQSTPSLLFAVVGSVITGVVFNQVQFWLAFTKIGELFILVPVLLNLKGCLEMNLASRLSTSVRPPSHQVLR
jgi:solute carrier family 41